MKTKFIATLIVLIVAATSSFGTVLTVSNYPAGGAQYSSLQAAFNASSNGDTMLIEGTDILYFMGCGARWDKSLVVIGIGYNPNKLVARKTIIRWMDCDSWFFIRSGGNGSKFYGIVFATPGSSCLLSDQPVSNYTFEDCQFNGHVSSNNNAWTNMSFRNCVFAISGAVTSNVHLAQSNAGSAQNILFTSCIFNGHIYGWSDFVTAIVDHCLFLGTTYEGTYLKGSTIQNCIFMDSVPSATNNVNCVFLNNITYEAGTMPPAGNSGTGNLTATNPNFVNFTIGQLYSASHDYHLQAGSPAIGAGAGGSDIGPHGSSSNFSETGEVLINPIVRKLIINNTVVQPNGTLDVQVQATKPTTF